ncbi:TetR family transcriptional regulator [Thermosporothrix hazakensis]|jgi:AcrR family transcriptional regulator|uniref:TetR family transcriptional regulator n=2 Tax=Thermosporothrix TaxID=768650 RepID=A0A326U8C2_THEHA|nr:TetR/AcrR family transcriptional regulator [Thermosporothrix hazakensis]PZW30495.1 TetR family transcriptional regulator [Thermosporothrix hazakensis]BBH91209.1 TetR family transcriptional regulator [Thermosporothrix sp. COM3]GCE49355.1 TetR family transcriptional regulator [Thermosporothrix hazakensis]
MQHTSTSHRSLKEKQRQERERLILAAAEEVFTQKGYHEASVDEIAARVGIAKGTIYLHFSSKEEILAAIFARSMQKILSDIDLTLDADTTPQAKLEAILLQFYTGFYSRQMQLLYAIFHSPDSKRILMEKNEGNKTLQETWRALADRIAKVLEEGKANGSVDKDTPTNIMVSVFFSLTSPRSYERLIVEDHMTPEEVARYLARVYFKGVAAQGS